jgi:hypothetical protein
MMLARVICFFLGHIYAELVIEECVQKNVYVRRGTCDRCGKLVFEVLALEDGFVQAIPTPDVVDERPKHSSLDAR